jgi:hypothetical protein
MSEFNFKSQICTSREQSERLLALGLKKETADCHWANFALFEDYEVFVIHAGNADDEDDIPAWSLHRLIELAYGNWKEDIAPIYLGNSYDMLIRRIEFQIKQGKFNKKYLCEN